MAKEKIDVLAELSALAPAKKSWLDKATPEAREKMMLIRQLRREGKCTYPKSTIHELARKNGILIGKDTLTAWLDEKS